MTRKQQRTWWRLAWDLWVWRRQHSQQSSLSSEERQKKAHFLSPLPFSAFHRIWTQEDGYLQIRPYQTPGLPAPWPRTNGLQKGSDKCHLSHLVYVYLSKLLNSPGIQLLYQTAWWPGFDPHLRVSLISVSSFDLGLTRQTDCICSTMYAHLSMAHSKASNPSKTGASSAFPTMRHSCSCACLWVSAKHRWWVLPPWLGSCEWEPAFTCSCLSAPHLLPRGKQNSWFFQRCPHRVSALHREHHGRRKGVALLRRTGKNRSAEWKGSCEEWHLTAVVSSPNSISQEN